MVVSLQTRTGRILLCGLVIAPIAGWLGVSSGTPVARVHAAARIARVGSTNLSTRQALSPRAQLAQAPLAFEPLADGSFAARTAGATIAVRGSRLFAIYNTAGNRSQVVTLTFLGAAPAPHAQLSEALHTRASYFIGNQPRAWRSGVRTYGRVTYQHLYPHIDVTYYGAKGRLEYDVRVAPGGNPAHIQLSAQGVGRVSVDLAGRLVLRTGGEAFTQDRPVAYQVVQGHRMAVQSAYTVDRQGRIGFHLGTYNHHLPLVIDPVLRYSTLFGVYDAVNAIAVDPAGNAYIVGYVSGQIITTTATLQAGTLVGSQDAYVAKLNASGGLAYSTYLGASSASGTGAAVAIAIDRHGSTYITGSTSSTTFPTTQHAFQPRLRGATDAFVAKLSPDGHTLDYSTYIGGSTDNADMQGANAGTGIAVDSVGNAYVTGYTQAYNFTLRHSFQSVLGYGKGTLGAQQDAFVTKLNSSGTGVLYSTYLGGSGTDTGQGIAVDKAGDAYVVGQTNSIDFPTTRHARQTSLFSTDYDIFLTKLNAGGAGVVFSTLLGKSAADKAHAIAVDSAGNAYVVGETTGGIPQTAGSVQPSIGPGIHGFILKMSPKGVLDYSTYLGGSGTDIAEGVAVDGAGNAYIAGQTSSAAFDTPVFPLKKALQGQLGGARGGFGMIDAFVSKINPCGSALLYSSYLGGTFVDSANGIGVDAHGDAVIAGSTFSPNFPLAHSLPNGGTYEPPHENAFIAKITNGPNAPRETCPLPLTVDTPASVNISTQPLIATIRTAPFAQVSMSVVITSGTPAAPGGAAAKPGVALYRVSTQGRADAYGLYVGSLQIKYSSSSALASFFTVSARSPHASATSVTPYTYTSH